MPDLIDINENELNIKYPGIIDILLKDNTTDKNIIWATDIYQEKGFGYQVQDQITIKAITGENNNVIKPRVKKAKEEQDKRTIDKAEVFTPSWVCNKQNNLIDNSWFERENVFNFEQDKTWQANNLSILFPNNKIWKDYVKENRLEITCGEAPYLVSRYDTVTGNSIPVSERIGLLDRKLRVVNENVEIETEWIEWAKIAFKSIYGYDWQGDNVFLARENLLFTFYDYYVEKYKNEPNIEYMKDFAKIISWNIWQMDGLKFVTPNSCETKKISMIDLFGEEMIFETECEGCKNNNIYKHNGIYCYVMNWETGKKEKFVSQIKKK